MPSKMLFWLMVLVIFTRQVEVYADVSIRLEEDTYVLPVAELASTKTYPEIIQVENEFLKITLIPNRGRVLSELVSKQGLGSFLFKNLKPNPMILPSGLHGVEFGGYYLSLPWNTRDRQPFDLNFEITRSTPGEAEVYLWGKDLFQKTLSECWVRVRTGIPVVEIEVAITNTSSRKAKELDFRDFLYVSPGDPPGEDQLMLPFDRVRILDSHNEWLGKQGENLRWPAKLSRWRDMEQFFHVQGAALPDQPCIALRRPSRRAAFLKFWQPASVFRNIETWSWGRSYQPEEGTDPYFAISGLGQGVTLPPKGSLKFKTYLALLDKVTGDASLDQLHRRALSYLE